MENLLQNLQNILNEALADLTNSESERLTELKDVFKDAHRFNKMSEDEQIIVTDACTSILESHIYESGADKKIANLIDDYHAITPNPCDRPARFEGDVLIFIKDETDNSNWMTLSSLDIIRHSEDRGNELDLSLYGFVKSEFIKLPKGVVLESDIAITCTIDPYCFEKDEDEDEYDTGYIWLNDK